jgi:hypothetical protein
MMISKLTLQTALVSADAGAVSSCSYVFPVLAVHIVKYQISIMNITDFSIPFHKLI